MLHSVREALAHSLVTPDDCALRQLATQVEVAVRRPSHPDTGPPRRVIVERDAARGPWLGYWLRSDGSGCWLALGWKPSTEASAVRDSLPLELDDHFQLARPDATSGSIQPFTAALVWVEYSAA